MRVITGSARGRRLASPAGLDTRPTAQMVKEAVFSAIQFEVENARMLDLFAGSGQMGIEALSRGALSCVFVDTSRESQQVIRQNLAATGFAGKAKLLGADAAAYLHGCVDTFDIAFLDPPYKAGVFMALLPVLASKMREGGAIFCESAKAEELPEQAGIFIKQREYRYGKTKVTLYRAPAEE